MNLVLEQRFLIFLLGLPCGIVAVTAGGGVTLGVPLLMLTGVAAGESVIDVKVALWAAFLTGSVSHTRNSQSAAITPSWWVWPMCLLGAICGSQLLTVIDPARLHGVVLALLVASVAGTVWATRTPKIANQFPSRDQHILGSVVILVLAVYSGFFGAGYGVFLIWALVSLHGHSPSTAAALGTRLSLVTSSAAVGVFLWHSAVSWPVTVPLASGCAVGGFVGARAVALLGDNVVRIATWSVSILVAVKLLVP